MGTMIRKNYSIICGLLGIVLFLCSAYYCLNGIRILIHLIQLFKEHIIGNSVSGINYFAIDLTLSCIMKVFQITYSVMGIVSFINRARWRFVLSIGIIASLSLLTHFISDNIWGYVGFSTSLFNSPSVIVSFILAYFLKKRDKGECIQTQLILNDFYFPYIQMIKRDI